MAHNLNVKDGKVSFFSVKEAAWHKLGKVLDNPPTSAEAIKEAGLDWLVEKRPLHVEQPDGKMVSYKDQFAISRVDTDDYLGIVGKRFTCVQNRDAFGFFDGIVGEGAAIYETAGALGKGERVFISAKLPDYIKLGNNDDIGKHLLFVMAHDGTMAVTVFFTPIRVVCQNTLNAALSSARRGSTVRISHTPDVHKRLAEAHKALKIGHKVYDELEEIFSTWTRKKVKDSEQQVFILESLKTASKGEFTPRLLNIRDSVLEFAANGPGQSLKTAKGTAWGTYNAITGYVDHIRLAGKDGSRRFDSAILGTGMRIKQRAFDMIAHSTRYGFGSMCDKYGVDLKEYATLNLSLN